MKRSIWIVLALFIISVGILCVTAVGIDMKKDDVTIEEKTLYGDKTALDGLHLDLNTSANDLMFWSTQYEPGTGEIDTQFRFGSQYAKGRSFGRISQGIWFNLHPYTVTAMGTGTDNVSAIKGFAQLYEAEGWADDVEQIVTGIAERTKSGEEHAEYIYLKDYCEVYPLRVDVSLGVGVGNMESNGDPYLSFAQELREYFQIPVHEDYRIEFSVRKDEKGRIQEISLSDDMFQEASYVAVDNFTLATEHGCFFAFQGRQSNQIPLDTSMIQGEFGVSYIPYVDNADGQKWAYFDNMKVVCGLDEDTYLEQMVLSKDGSKVYLLMQDEDMLKFIMIDAKTGDIVQTMPLIDRGMGDVVDLAYEYDKFIAINIAGDNPRILVIDKTDSERYEHALTAAVTDAADMGARINWSYVGYDETGWTDEGANTTMAWDGERLAVAAFDDRGYYFTCSFHLAVYDKSGLLYCGSHKNSLDILRNGSYGWSEDWCHPNETDKWSLSWK